MRKWPGAEVRGRGVTCGTGSELSNLGPPRELSDVLPGAISERLDRRGRLAPTARHQTRAVADEEVPHVVGSVMAIHHRSPRVVAHPARPQQVGRESRLLYRLPPGSACAGGFEDLDRPLLQEAHHR